MDLGTDKEKQSSRAKNIDRKEERQGRMDGDGVGIRNGLDRNGRAAKEGSKCDKTRLTDLVAAPKREANRQAKCADMGR